jgi:hypothetical protein
MLPGSQTEKLLCTMPRVSGEVALEGQEAAGRMSSD